jgi:hypothetical protein
MAPALVALLCEGLAALLPADQIWSQVLLSGLLAGRPWLGLLGLPYLLWLGRRKRSLGLPLLGALPCLLLIGRPPPGLPAALPPGAVRVLVTNVNSFADNPDHQPQIDFLAATQAEVIVVIERRPDALPGYRRVADNFDQPLPRISHATAVFCREDFPCAALVTEEFGSDTMKMPLALVALPGGRCLLGVHAPPPAPIDASGMGPYIERLAGVIDQGRMTEAWGPCAAGDRVVLAGDLNAVPQSPAWRRLVGRGLHDAFAGSGLFAASWPAGAGWPNAPFFQLDHLLLSEEVALLGVERVRVPDTDHKATLLALGPT